LDYFIIPDQTKFGADYALIPVKTHLIVFDHPPGTIVGYDSYKWNTMADRRAEFHDVEANGPVSANQNYVGLRPSQFSANGERNPHANSRHWACIDDLGWSESGDTATGPLCYIPTI
jgi:hypothetical protein